MLPHQNLHDISAVISQPDSSSNVSSPVSSHQSDEPMDMSYTASQNIDGPIRSTPAPIRRPRIIDHPQRLVRHQAFHTHRLQKIKPDKKCLRRCRVCFVNKKHIVYCFIVGNVGQRSYIGPRKI